MREPVLAVVSSARGAWGRAEAWGRTPVPAVAGLEFDALLSVVTTAGRPLVQRTARAGVDELLGWLRQIPARAGGWGAGPARDRCAWGRGA